MPQPREFRENVSVTHYISLKPSKKNVKPDDWEFVSVALDDVIYKEMRMAFGVNTRQFNFRSVYVRSFLNRETNCNPSQCDALTPVEPQSRCDFLVVRLWGLILFSLATSSTTLCLFYSFPVATSPLL